MEKFIRKLLFAIEVVYQAYGVHIKAWLHSISSNAQQYVFRLCPELGTKVAAIFERAEDVQAVLQVPHFQLFREGVGIYLSVATAPAGNNHLLTVLNSPAFRNDQAQLPIALGYDLMGRMVIEDLTEMPHALYIGATRSGKSMGLICLIMSLICRNSVKEVNLVVLDIGGRTLSILRDVPHLSCPIITDMISGICAIRALTNEMERRYTWDDAELNDHPSLVCVIDEYVNFIGGIAKANRGGVENNLTSIQRRGRKVKIHLVLATQNPKKGAMVAETDNITARMVFKVARFQNSTASLNRGGAEKLPGNGAMFYTSMAHPEPRYIQGAYISTEDTKQLVEKVILANRDLSRKFVIPEYVPSESAPMSEVLLEDAQDDDEKQQELAEIILWMLGRSDVSAERIKKSFSIGNRAMRIMDGLCEMGLVSEKYANQPRRVLPQCVEDVPDDVLQLLSRHGYSAEKVSAAISKRHPCEPTNSGDD